MNKSVHPTPFVPSKTTNLKIICLELHLFKKLIHLKHKKKMHVFRLPLICSTCSSFYFFLLFFRGHRESWTARERNCTMLKFYWKLLSIYGNYMYFIPLEGRNYLQSYTMKNYLYRSRKLLKLKLGN